jgi:16S rRNA (uracil1498-N3)-methyltransferase
VFLVTREALQHEEITLDGDEGRHAATVKRIRVGESILLTDGQGSGAECQVQSVAKASLTCQVRVRRVAPTVVPRLTVVQAIPKGEHADRAVDLLTEVGVTRLVPWAAARNIVTWRGDRADKGVARWQAVSVAAAKQARRLRFPEVLALHSIEDVAALAGGADLAVALHESASESLAALVAQAADRAGGSLELDDVVLVVGPEGGITDEELAVLSAAGAEVAHVGPTVLRSSTAGVVAASVVLSHTRAWRGP